MGKRIFLFLATNLLVVTTVSIVLSIVGIDGNSIGGLAGICFIYGMIGAFISLYISRWTAKKFYKIKIIKSSNKNSKKIFLYNAAESISKKAGIKMPEVGIYESSDPNAFATGPNQNNSLIAFSSSILENLDEEEIKAVVAHEISHIKNGDMVTMTLLTGVANAFVMFLARIVATIIIDMMSDDDSPIGYWGYFLIVMVLQTIFMLLAYIPINSFSRYREYRADFGAAKLTTPQSMINALNKLDSICENLVGVKSDEYSVAKINSRSKLALFSTHPSISQRIGALKKYKR
jgi:heat shock protein HtpX